MNINTFYCSKVDSISGTYNFKIASVNRMVTINKMLTYIAMGRT